MRKHLTTLGACALLAACAATPRPDTAGPVEALPAQWRHGVGETSAATVDAAWWRGFGSPELDAVVQRARVQSLDTAAAVARVARADAAARAAGAALWPALNVQADVARQDRLGGAAPVDGRSAGLGLAASYELDLWGRNAAARDSARRTAQAAAFERDTVQLSVTAGAADLWLQAVALAERRDIAALNLRSAQRLLALVEARARAGAATSLELAQQRGLVATQRRSAAELRQQYGGARIALAVWLGEFGDGSAAPPTPSLDTLRVPVADAGLPASVLARRPDIARAEALLAAADADIVAARAAMLPTVTLGGSAGYAGERLRGLFDNPLYSLSAGLAAPVFDAGRLSARADEAAARRAELLAAYRQAIVAAFGDVEVALGAVAGTLAQADAQDEVLRQARRAATLAESRYRAGAETLLTLLDAQRTHYAAQDAAVQARLARLRSSVALYRAIGGGWQASAVGPASQEAGS